MSGAAGPSAEAVPSSGASRPAWREAGMSRPARRGAALRARVLRTASAASDLLPPRLRYGHARTLAGRLLGRTELPVLAAPAAAPSPPAPRAVGTQVVASQAESATIRVPTATGAGATGVTCVLVAGGLDVGGVEAVVATLALGLPGEGVRAVVVGTGEGRTADRLRAAGVTVIRSTPSDLAGVLTGLAPDVVQVHDASAAQGVAAWGGPAVWVAHNLEIHRGADEWAAVSSACARADSVVAVSDAVALHHSRHTGGSHDEVVVIPNGVGHLAAGPGRAEARAALGGVVPVEADDVVVVSLARYDAQKNVPGLVRAFARALLAEPRLRLVVAGGVADVLEHRWADAERVASGAESRVHLLGPSDSATLLAAADAFVLGSFFEGWSVAATEAVVAGLPVVLSDVGGAVELAALAPGRVTVVRPPTGDAPLTDWAVRESRRRRRQDNEAELAAALAALPGRPPVEPDPGLLAVLSAGEMVARHAGLLRHVTPGVAGRTR
ncbi:glycosyltransferase [Antribacter gilvus]|uniref:glycosyltransferase n=1 Tax=Antribacter gilvus TaxID=2304675 RepID=UPI000F772C08|nr:glycosyltransferase [Antribacter gilvus]